MRTQGGMLPEDTPNIDWLLITKYRENAFRIIPNQINNIIVLVNDSTNGAK